MSDYDSPWKEALSVYFEPFMALFLPDAHAEIDWGRGCQPLDHELRQIVPAGEPPPPVEHLVQVWLASGEEQWVLVHVAVQASEGFARRVFDCNSRLFDRYARKVVSLAVLGDDNPDWRPDRFGYDQWRAGVAMWFRTVKLLDYAQPPELLEASGNPFTLVVLAHLMTGQTRQDQRARYVSKVWLIKRLCEGGWSAQDLRQLFAIIDWMMDLPKPLDVEFWREIKQFEEEKYMPFMTTPERIGREEGLAEGLTEGLTKGLTRGIEVALEVKFGEAGLALMPEIRAIEDQAKLEAVLHALPAATSLEDLRRVWTGGA